MPTLSSVLTSTPVKGLLAGLAGTMALDRIGTAIYERERRATWLAENRARGFHHAYERGVINLARSAGRRLSRRGAVRWGWRLHESFGVSQGALYAALRRRIPAVGWGFGLAYGAAFFLLADELLMPLLGWTPGPRRFSWKVHARGAVSHIAYGVATETTLRLFDALAKKAPASRPIEKDVSEGVPAI